MAKVTLALGYFTERPYGSLADTPKGAEFRSRQLVYMEKLNQAFDADNVPRTFFILGEYLAKCAKHGVSKTHLQNTFRVGQDNVEIAQHSYSHPTFRGIATRLDKTPVTIPEFIADVRKGNEVVEEILGVRPKGMGTPCGYHHDLSDFPDLVKLLDKFGLAYVSSEHRAEKSLLAPLTVGRLAHTYSPLGYPNLVEIPTHGWQDVIFTKEKYAQELPTLLQGKEIVDHYVSLVEKAMELSETELHRSPIHLMLALHPWAAMEYDPGVTLIREVIENVRKHGAEVLTAAEVAKRVLR